MGVPLERLSMKNNLLERVKSTVTRLLPDAQVILYGSRSRKDAGPESDWDFLVLTDSSVEDSLIDSIRHQLYEIEWETGEILSAIIRNRKEWNSPPLLDTPFHMNIENEGMSL